MAQDSGRGNGGPRLLAWVSVAAGVGLALASFAPMFSASPRGGPGAPADCTAWSECPGERYALFDYFLGFDPVGFRLWLVMLMALVAIAIPLVVAIGRPTQLALVRFGHLAATVIVAAGLFVLFAALGTDTRSTYFTEVLWSFTLKPAWGGWAILLLTAVVLVSAIGIAFGRKPARAADSTVKLDR